MIVNHMIEVAFVIIAMEVCSSLLFFNHKAELLQLNRTQFPSLGFLSSPIECVAFERLELLGTEIDPFSPSKLLSIGIAQKLKYLWYV